MRTRAIIAVLLVLTLTAATGCDESGRLAHDKADELAVTDTSTSAIFGFVVDSENLSTLAAAIGAAGLVDRFESDKPYTLFAPDNEAWSELGEDRIENLMTADTKNLRQGILNHTVKGRVLTQDMYNGQVLESVGGPKLKVRVKDAIYYVNGAMITRPNTTVGNSVVHVVNKVIR